MQGTQKAAPLISALGFGKLMKYFFVTLTTFFFINCTAFSGQNTVEFRLAYHQETKDTIIVHEKNSSNILYIEKGAVLNTGDLKIAKVIIDKKDPPVWFKMFSDMAGTPIINPQISIELIFTKDGRKKLKRVTRDNVGNFLAIYINDDYIMAPKIIDKLDTEKIRIGSHFKDWSYSLLQRQEL